MCGIAGFWGAPAPKAELREILEAMARSMVTRGPDGFGAWANPALGLGLAHARLAVIDLSRAGAQPMASASGDMVLIYNGEIYNHLDLRRELDQEHSIEWKSRCDTEVLVECLARWGVERTLERVNGMFALACWDRANRRLILARDRMGIKPLYYGMTKGKAGRTLLFGSQLKPFLCHPGFTPRLNHEALGLYFRHLAVPAPFCIYQGLAKLMPGTWMEIGQKDLEQGQLPEPRTYWDLESIAQTPGPLFSDGQEAESELAALLADSVKLRSIADVPLGVFLSGGVDSSLVAALLAGQASGPVKSFCVGFDQAEYDESPHARLVAEHLGTDHHELRLGSDQALETILTLPEHFDEPFADASQIPMHLVSALARKRVVVALSGDGGDELFAGYNRHVLGPPLWRKLAWLPRSLRGVLAAGLGKSGHALAGLFLPKAARQIMVADKLDKLAAAAQARNLAEFHDLLARCWQDRDFPLVWIPDPEQAGSGQGLNTLGYMLLADQQGYLPNDILTKVDRASMAVSLEARVPFLDHRLVEFSWKVPASMKIRRGVGKRILRNLLGRHLDPALFERPKQGFSVPLEHWLRGPLKDWARDLLAPERLARTGIIRPEPVARAWKELQSGRPNRQLRVWTILMAMAWLDRYNPSL